MRPRKKILLVDSDFQAMSALKFSLFINGYCVLAAETAQDAIGLFSDNCVDLVLCDATSALVDAPKLIGRLKQIASHIPMILLGKSLEIWPDCHGADACLVKRTVSMCELLERVKVMAARKRGPRPGSHRKPVQSVGVDGIKRRSA